MNGTHTVKMFNSTIFKAYGKGIMNVSTNKACITNFFNYSLPFLKDCTFALTNPVKLENNFHLVSFCHFQTSSRYLHDLNAIMIGFIVKPKLSLLKMKL